MVAPNQIHRSDEYLIHLFDMDIYHNIHNYYHISSTSGFQTISLSCTNNN